MTKRGLLLLVALTGCRSDPEATPTDARPATGVDAARSVTTSAAPAGSAALVANDCLGCHGEDLLAQQRLSPKQWDAIVKKMQGWGSQVEPENVERLTEYLASHYHSGAGSYATVELAAAEAESKSEPTPDGRYGSGDLKNGRDLYVERCQVCHAPDGRGGPKAVNVADRYLLYRAEDFAAVVRKGHGRMPAFVSSDREIADLLAFLRTLPGR